MRIKNAALVGAIATLGVFAFSNAAYAIIAPPPTALPEPGVLWLFGAGLGGLALARTLRGLGRRKRKDDDPSL